MDDNFTKQLRRAPIVKTFLFWKNFDRASPVYWVFVFAVFVSLASIIIYGSNIVFWTGTALWLFFIVPALIFVVIKLK